MFLKNIILIKILSGKERFEKKKWSSLLLTLKHLLFVFVMKPFDTEKKKSSIPNI